MSVESPFFTNLEVADPPNGTGARHARRVRRLPLWITVILWVVVMVMAVVAAMRLFAWDALEPFAVLNTVTELIYLPAWIILIVALIGKRYSLALAALVIAVLQVLFMLPELTAAEPLPAWTKGAPTISLLDANVYNVNPSMAGYAAQIKAARPDLVTMEEAVPRDVRQLHASGALAGLPYTIEVKRDDPDAFFIASRYPLAAPTIVYRYGRPLIVKTAIALPSGSQPLWVVHTTAPLPPAFSQWKGQVATIAAQIKATGTAHLLVAGDFNSTWSNKGFRQILAEGMTDGAAARGHPFDMTWSQTKQPLPPLVRIDHVLTGPGVAVTAIASGPGPGSDHRDLHATIAFER